MSSTSPSIDALTSTLRACLVRAYEHGAADGAARLLQAAGVSVAPVPPKPKKRKQGGKHILSRQTVLAAFGKRPMHISAIAKAAGAEPSRVSGHLAHMARAGDVIRVGPGTYQRAAARAEG